MPDSHNLEFDIGSYVEFTFYGEKRIGKISSPLMGGVYYDIKICDPKSGATALYRTHHHNIRRLSPLLEFTLASNDKEVEQRWKTHRYSKLEIE